MKTPARISFLVVFIIFFIHSCGSLREVKLQKYPGFELKTEKYSLITPIVPTTGNNEYTLENINSNRTFKLNITLEKERTDVDVIDTDKDNDITKTKSQEFTAHIFKVINPMDSSMYKVIGKTTYYRTREEEKKSSFETGNYIFPIDFWIYDKDKDAGKITIIERGRIENKVVSTPIQIVFHGNEYYLEYQNTSNNITVTFEDSTGLVALVGLKPKSTITTKLKGDILINHDLSYAVQSDICSLYLMVTAAVSRISGPGFRM